MKKLIKNKKTIEKNERNLTNNNYTIQLFLNNKITNKINTFNTKIWPNPRNSRLPSIVPRPTKNTVVSLHFPSKK